MSNEMTTQDPQSITIWDDRKEVEEIKKMYGKGLSEGEFMLFLKKGKFLNLNPFMGQIYAYKYGNNPASIIISKDGYLVNALRDPRYRGSIVSAYYSNDIMKRLPDGTIHHESNYNNRGKLIGAYAIVYREGLSVPVTKDVLLSEYDKKKSTWASMPETMIKKVAESQALRAAFMEMFEGTYHESELWDEGKQSNREQSKTKTYTYQKPKPVEREPIQYAEYQEVAEEQSQPNLTDQTDRIIKGLTMIKEKYATLEENYQAEFAIQCHELTGKEFPNETMTLDQIIDLYKIIKEL